MTEQLQGFFTEVTLSTGVVVRIRKIDEKKVENAAVVDLIGQLHAQGQSDEGAVFLEGLLKDAEANPESVPAGLLDHPEHLLTLKPRTEVAFLRAACKSPTLDALVGLYEGSFDEPDLGLGPDYSLLLAYIRQHNVLAPVGTAPNRAARRTRKK